MSTSFLIALIILVALVFIVLTKAFMVISQGSAVVVERFGRYRKTLNPGLNIVVPFITTTRNRIDLREQVASFPAQSVITRDNLAVGIDTLIYYQVTDARAATYEVVGYVQAIEQLTVTTLRKIIGGMDLARALASREEINADLRRVLDATTGKWGIRVNRVGLKTIEPPEGKGAREAPRTAPRSQPKTDVPPVHQPLQEGDPRRIDHYELKARLGQGGMGTVHLGRTPGGRSVAVKVIQRELATDPEFRRRFAREIVAASEVSGFYTAAVVAADAQGDPPWLVTEYIPGPSLHDALRRHGALPAKTVQTLAIGIAEALQGIHQRGIVHRDLKPGNIILSSTGPRVIDSALGLLPSRLSGIVARCLDHDPAGRPPPAEVIERLADRHSSDEVWLPPLIRTLVDLHNQPIQSAG